MIQQVKEKDRAIFNKLASHPLQSWEWGEFRESMGIKVIRLGKYENDNLIEVIQLTVHKLPLKFSIGYIPKSPIPSKEMFEKLSDIGKENNCIFIKLEPNVLKGDSDFLLLTSNFRITSSSHPLFTRYSFILDLNKSDEEFLKSFHNKTRYNIKIAQKNGVVICENNSASAFKKYLALTDQTLKRQMFFAHDREYHVKMWEALGKAGIAHLFTAKFIHDGKENILAAWILFIFNKVIYYPYGASSNAFRNVMASNLMMWEAIRWGKKMGAEKFDMWGSLGPDADPSDPWFGFHRFKQGYGTTLVEFAGSYDLIINPLIYKLYNIIYLLRGKFLKAKALIRNIINKPAL